MANDPWTTKAEPTDPDELSKYFERSASAVHRVSAQLESGVVRPAYDAVCASLELRPLATTFAVVFVALSFLPFAVFATAALAIFVSFLLSAVLAALFASAGLIGVLAFFLALTLVGTLLASALLTSAILGTYILARTLRSMSDPTNARGLLDTLGVVAGEVVGGSSSGSGARAGSTDASTPANSNSESPLVKKPDGTLDGPATVAKHRELNGAHMSALDSTHHEPSDPAAHTSAPKDEGRPAHLNGGADGSAPVATKPDGTQDGAATHALHAQRDAEHAARLEDEGRLQGERS